MDQAFKAATERVASSKKKVSNKVKLELYGYYKQATEPKGSANELPKAKGGIKGSHKRKAWAKVVGMPPQEAMQRYVETVNANQI